MIGKRIRLLRDEREVTQRELAQYLGLTPKMISFYENDERFPPYDIIIKLSEFFNCSTDYILGRTDIKNPADRISEVLDNDKELYTFWDDMKDREDLQVLFKQTKDLSPKAIQQVIRIIKAIEEEEDRENE